VLDGVVSVPSSANIATNTHIKRGAIVVQRDWR